MNSADHYLNEKFKKKINVLMEDELGGKYGQNLPH